MYTVSPDALYELLFSGSCVSRQLDNFDVELILGQVEEELPAINQEDHNNVRYSVTRGSAIKLMLNRAYTNGALALMLTF